MLASSSRRQAEGEPLPLLRQPRFRRLTAARFAARLAQNALNFALALLVVEETGKAFYSSLLVLALVVPTTVAGLVAGVLSDHLPKSLLMAAGHLLRAAICVTLARSTEGAADYFVAAAAMSLANPLASAAEGATVPLVVERRLLARANAMNQATTGLAQLAGFGLLTPVMLRVFDSPTALFWTCAGLFVAAALFALRLGRIPTAGEAEVGGESGGSWYAVGWRQLRADGRTWQATTELTLISTSVIILGALVPAYLREVLDLRIDVGAVVLLPGAVGVALGLRLAGFLAHRVPHALLSTLGFFVYVSSLWLLAFANPVADFLGGYSWFGWLEDVDIWGFDGGAVVAMGMVFPLGFAYAVVTVAAQTVVNDLVPLRFQGRAQSMQAVLAAIAASGPVLIAGAVSDVTGVVPVMAAVAAGTAAAAVLAPRWRRTSSEANGR